jgi:hypothetical protein
MMVHSRYPNLAISIREDDEHVYALCPAFGLISEADTVDAAISTLDDLRDRAAALYHRAGWEPPYSLTKEELEGEIGHAFRARAIKILSQVARNVVVILNQIARNVVVILNQIATYVVVMFDQVKTRMTVRKWLIGAYLFGAIWTLIFQIYVREPVCAVRGDCGLSFTKGVVWSLIWPASWFVIAGTGGLSFTNKGAN